jgi:hypothetical protein
LTAINIVRTATAFNRDGEAAGKALSDQRGPRRGIPEECRRRKK